MLDPSYVRRHHRELKPADNGEETPATGTDAEEKARKNADARLRRLMPSGAILRVDLDPEHWLSFGAGTRIAVMKRGSQTLITAEPTRTVGRFGDPENLHLGGLLWPEAAGRIVSNKASTPSRSCLMKSLNWPPEASTSPPSRT